MKETVQQYRARQMAEARAAQQPSAKSVPPASKVQLLPPFGGSVGWTWLAIIVGSVLYVIWK